MTAVSAKGVGRSARSAAAAYKTVGQSARSAAAANKIVVGCGVVVGCLLATGPAAAQEILLTGPLAGAPAVSRSYHPTPGSKLAQGFLLPSEMLEAGGDIVFLTGTPAEKQPELELTDVGLLRLRARRSLGQWGEVFVGTQLLAKQPESWDEPIWQSALGGLLVPFGHRLAWSLYGGGGKLLGEPGGWYQLQPTLLAKPVVDKFVRFELALGHSILLLDVRNDTRTFWLEEIAAHAEAQLGDDSGGFWVGIDYGLPIGSGPDYPDAPNGRYLDPNVTLGLQIGGVLTPRGSDWDLFVIYTIVDRGDLDRPETRLPILDGGFDQRQLAIGVQHRFGRKKSSDDDDGYYR